MINRETKKYEPSFIVVGGVSFYRLSDLILLKGTMKEFAYAQALENYKEIFDFLKNKIKTYCSNKMVYLVILEKKSKSFLEIFLGINLFKILHIPQILHIP